MALVDYNAPIKGLSGKPGTDDDGLVYYLVDGRGIARQFVVPNQPNSTQQQVVRNTLTSLAGAFTALTPVQVEGWRDFAANETRRDRLGRKYTLSAVQAFQRVNSHRVLAGQTALSDAPVFQRMPAPIDLTLTISGGNLELTLTHTNATGSGFWRIRMTPKLPTSTRKARLGDLRSLTHSLGGAYAGILASPQGILHPLASLRFAYSAGDHVGVEILALSSNYAPGLTLFNPSIAIG